ncbi:MAG: hypothetical protein IH605_06460 [Burkholderiales bacterium]|nr:hypothetical protein [Burkholderiales bacterium]
MQASWTPLPPAAIARVCVLALFFWNRRLILLWLCMLVGVVGGKVSFVLSGPLGPAEGMGVA